MNFGSSVQVKVSPSSKPGIGCGCPPSTGYKRPSLVAKAVLAINLPSGEIWHEFKLILSYRLPLILGNDVAGVVVQAGRHVRRFKVGDQV